MVLRSSGKPHQVASSEVNTPIESIPRVVACIGRHYWTAWQLNRAFLLRGAAATIVDLGRDDVSVARQLERVVAQFGALDSVVVPVRWSCVGHWGETLDSCMTDLFLIAKTTHRFLTESGRGRLVLLLPAQPQAACADRASYVAVKAGIEAAACGLAVSWAGDDILVSVVDPDAEADLIEAACRLAAEGDDGWANWGCRLR